MNREMTNRFSNVPFIEKPRSKFYRPQKHLTSFSRGKFIPIYLDEVLPGDSMKVNIAAVIRMATPLFPVMDDLIRDVMAWYVPSRLVWDHWQEFQGENKLTAWEQPIDYEIPQITAPATTGWVKGTVADYMGIPTNVPNLSVNALPFKAYAMIWNEFMRDENLKDAVMINTDDTTLTGSNGTGALDTYITTGQLGAQPLVVAKTHDYFTSALPNVQKSSDPGVLIPITSRGATGFAPVRTGNDNTGVVPTTTLRWYENAISSTSANGQKYALMFRPYRDETGDLAGFARARTEQGSSSSGSNDKILAPANLWADLNDTTFVQHIGTINELRTSFAVQRILEAFARGGTRYTEILKNIWGVQAPDARLQRPEYLGGQRIPIQVRQVLNHSNAENEPVGETGAFSNTAFSEFLFNKSFVEHGYLIITVCVRIKNHTYQQGLHKLWSRKTRYDFYMPQLAYLGEQAVLEKEIYAQGTGVTDTDGNIIDDTVFGYQERWAEYRYKPNRVSGAMRSNYSAGSLDSWHYADYYSSMPTLSSEWIDEGTAEIDRTLAVQSEREDQFWGDFLIMNESTRMMPVYSVPGLLDHY